MQTSALQLPSAKSPEEPGSAPLYRSPALLFFLGAMLSIYLGWKVLPLSRYITPERGLGYVLGILGGGFMLLLLIYPARKRLRWLGCIGSVKAWFRIHMALGVVGPILVLYHANFSLGAANSNVALVCMLLVAGSGLVGRYFYSKIHEGLYGHESTLAELQARAGKLRQMAATLPLLSGLLERLEEEELRIAAATARQVVVVRPVFAAASSYSARWRLARYLHETLRNTDHAAKTRLLRIARQYIATRIRAARRVAEYQAYVSLFSWWHILHLPLFMLLLIAGVVHVIAVHVY